MQYRFLSLTAAVTLGVLAVGTGAWANAPTPATTGAASAANIAAVKGNYIEARSLSVYGGACHYNGEMTTAGREAVLAWQITEGRRNGVNLGGVSALALVAGNDNLGMGEAQRRAVLYVSDKATTAQRNAIVALLKEKVGSTLGEVVAVKTAPLAFTQADKNVSVKAPGIADLEAVRYPCSHCRMPAQTWYGPLTPTTSEVAQGISTGFTDKTLGVSWSQTESDNVYVGTFAL